MSEQQQEFVKLFSQYQRRLFLYILAQVPNPADAEEIQQETNVVIWSKFHTFQQGTNFFAWACKIANFEVLKYRDRRRRDRHYFSDEFLKAVANEILDEGEHWEQRQRALAVCLTRLSEKDYELIQRRYAPGENGKTVAEYLRRPINAVYQSLGRIRRALFDCINRQLATEDFQSDLRLG
ncbi:MAG: RNA polymerase subunit sigma [Planctomycetaceae bacterium]|nr:RNA polymerase subunit sigma [Planctomycetaceae bacterium]